MKLTLKVEEGKLYIPLKPIIYCTKSKGDESRMTKKLTNMVDKNVLVTVVSNFQADRKGDVATYYLEGVTKNDNEETSYAVMTVYYSYLSSNWTRRSHVTQKSLRAQLMDDFRNGAVVSVKKTSVEFNQSNMREQYNWSYQMGYTFTSLCMADYQKVVDMVAEIEKEGF